MMLPPPLMLSAVLSLLAAAACRFISFLHCCRLRPPITSCRVITIRHHAAAASELPPLLMPYATFHAIIFADAAAYVAAQSPLFY